jgi:cytochrome c peroxidase
MGVTFHIVSVLLLSPILVISSSIYAATKTTNDTQLTAKITLGRYLFNDNRLSKTGNRSCALCHAFFEQVSTRCLVDAGMLNHYTHLGLSHVFVRIIANILYFLTTSIQNLDRQICENNLFTKPRVCW